MAAAAVREAEALGVRAAEVLLDDGADQIVDLLALMGDAAADAAGWPEAVRAALGTQGFRDQVRDLFMRAVEHGVTAGELAELDDRQGPDGTPGLWRAAGRLMQEYEQVTALSSQAAVDAAWVVAAAADLLVVDDDADARERLHRARRRADHDRLGDGRGTGPIRLRGRDHCSCL